MGGSGFVDKNSNVLSAGGMVFVGIDFSDAK
jgi:hypothetical protein